MDSGQFREWFQSQLARREWTQRDFSTAASPADLRAILETVGPVVYGPDGVWIRYVPPFDAFVPEPRLVTCS